MWKKMTKKNQHNTQKEEKKFKGSESVELGDKCTALKAESNFDWNFAVRLRDLLSKSIIRYLPKAPESGWRSRGRRWRCIHRKKLPTFNTPIKMVTLCIRKWEGKYRQACFIMYAIYESYVTFICHWMLTVCYTHGKWERRNKWIFARIFMFRDAIHESFFISLTLVFIYPLAFSRCLRERGGFWAKRRRRTPRVTVINSVFRWY